MHKHVWSSMNEQYLKSNLQEWYMQPSTQECNQSRKNVTRHTTIIHASKINQHVTSHTLTTLHSTRTTSSFTWQHHYRHEQHQSTTTSTWNETVRDTHANEMHAWPRTFTQGERNHARIPIYNTPPPRLIWTYIGTQKIRNITIDREMK